MKKYRIKLGNLYLKEFKYNYGEYVSESRYITFSENEYFIFNKMEDTLLIGQLINKMLDINIVVEEFTLGDEE